MPGSTLAEDGYLYAEVTHRCRAVEELEESVWNVVRQENEREGQGEGVQNSGNNSTDVQCRDMGDGEGTGREIGGRRNENASINVRSYEAGQDQKWKINRDNESGGNHKESPWKKVEPAWACDEKRGTLRRKEGDGNEGTGEKEERMT